MTVWLERKEKIKQHAKFLAWQIANKQEISVSLVVIITCSLSHSLFPQTPLVDLPLTPQVGRPHKDMEKPRCRIEMTQHATVQAVQLQDLQSQYGATFFRNALACFVAEWKYPTLTRTAIEQASGGIFFHFQTIPVFHKIKLWLEDVRTVPNVYGTEQDLQRSY